jgi:hypothetical protein
VDSAAILTPAAEPEENESTSPSKLLPAITADESSIGWGDREEDSDRFYLEQRPPHYED